MHAPSAVGAPYEANLHPNPQHVCPAAAKQASADSSPLDGMQANCKPIGQLYINTNHHSGTWARRAQNCPCRGYAELAPKVKFQG
eukprot:7383369-Prymnesium_polylepis.1